MTTLIYHAKPERQQIIAVTEPRTPAEQTALNAALFERERADRYEVTLRHALNNLEDGLHAVARAQIRIALLQIQ